MTKPSAPALQALHTKTVCVPVGSRPWKARAVAAVLGATLLMAGSGLAQARQAERAAPFVELGSLDSRAGEAKDAFIVRVGQAMAQASAGRRGQEVCGMIMTTPQNDAWRVRLVANGMHMGCAALRFDEPGYLPSGETIHTHQTRGPITAEQVQSIAEGNGEYDHGPGYVVAGGGVFSLQHPLVPVDQIGRYDRAQPAPALTLGQYRGKAKIRQDVQDDLKSRLGSRRGAHGSTRGNPPGR